MTVQEVLPGRAKNTIDSFIRRFASDRYHFEQFMPGYSGPSFPWPSFSAPKAPSSKLRQGRAASHDGGLKSLSASAAQPQVDLEGVEPLRLAHPSREWSPEEWRKLEEGLKRFCGDVIRLQVSPCSIGISMKPGFARQT